YYSYIWIQVFDADTVRLFEENSRLDRTAGVPLRRAILSRGGSLDAMDAFQQIQGRDPQPAPLHRPLARTRPVRRPSPRPLADIQRPDGSWHNYYLPDGDRDATVEEAKIDTNVVAYIATGVWHHWRCTGDRGFVDNLWPTVERALDCVLDLRRNDGLVLWAV